MILNEFDPTETAIINPTDVQKPIKYIPKIAIACYPLKIYKTIIDRYGKDGCEVISTIKTSNGIQLVYKITYRDRCFVLALAYVGASPSVGLLEELFAMGVETVVVFGTCGVLDRTIERNTIIIPTSAVRCEGTSYHYVEPSDEIEVNAGYVDKLENLLVKMNLEHVKGKVWTTDAFYRETRKKADEHRKQGCICVDMECSANAAVAKFRKKRLIQFLYATDSLDAEKWDIRAAEDCEPSITEDDITTFAMELAYSFT